jgi:hypothetical protein
MSGSGRFNIIGGVAIQFAAASLPVVSNMLGNAGIQGNCGRRCSWAPSSHAIV